MQLNFASLHRVVCSHVIFLISMKKSVEINYLISQWKQLYASFAAYLKHKHQDDLHDFRVQVKKIKALFALSGNATQPALVRKFKPVKKVFRQAGEIRSAFMNLELYDKQHVPGKKYRKQQQRLMKKAVHCFIKSAPANRRRLKRTWRKIRKMIRPAGCRQVNNFYRDELRQAGAMLAGERLHDCRKLLKSLIYNYQWAADMLYITLNVAYLEQLEDAIGKWHDRSCAALQMDKAKDHLHPLSPRLNEERLLLQRVTELGKDFYKKAVTVKNRPVH